MVFRNSLENELTVIWSNFGFHNIPNILSLGKLTTSRFAIFSEISSFGKVFKIPIQYQFCNIDDTDKMIDSAVVKSLKESK